MSGRGRGTPALLFPELAPMPADVPVPAPTIMRRAGHTRRLAEAAAQAVPFVEPTLPCRHGQCRIDPRYRARPGRGQCAWCPGCPGHMREKGGRTLCVHD